MRVCLVNTFHYPRGGDSTYTFDLARLLRSRGDDVIHFAMEHPQNLESGFATYFPEHVDYRDVFGSRNPLAKIRAFLRCLYSYPAKAKFEAVLNDLQPDVIHLQNFRRHLTFSIVVAAANKGVPVVFTAHDYDPICPSSLLFARGRICSVCHGKDYHKAVFTRCKEDSLLGSLAVALEGMFVRMRNYYDLIDVIITPSQFARTKLIECGFNPARVQTVHNFIDTDAYVPKYGGDYMIYFGRLAPEKGVDTLIEAAAQAPTVRVLIAGEGPQRSHLEELSLKSGAKNVEFLGYVDRSALHGIVRDATAVVMPSKWFENFPYTILEAFALGKPVIGANIGGIPETVTEEETGLLFSPGDAAALSDQMARLQRDRSLAEQMGRKARNTVEKKFNATSHYRKISTIYQRLIRR